MNEKNNGTGTAEPKKAQKPARRYNRKPKQSKGDALAQAVQSAIELVNALGGAEKKSGRP